MDSSVPTTSSSVFICLCLSFCLVLVFSSWSRRLLCSSSSVAQLASSLTQAALRFLECGVRTRWRWHCYCALQSQCRVRVTSCHVMFCYILSCHVMTRLINVACRVVSCRVAWCGIMLGHDSLLCVISFLVVFLILCVVLCFVECVVLYFVYVLIRFVLFSSSIFGYTIV